MAITPEHLPPAAKRRLRITLVVLSIVLVLLAGYVFAVRLLIGHVSSEMERTVRPLEGLQDVPVVAAD